MGKVLRGWRKICNFAVDLGQRLQENYNYLLITHFYTNAVRNRFHFNSRFV